MCFEDPLIFPFYLSLCPGDNMSGVTPVSTLTGCSTAQLVITVFPWLLVSGGQWSPLATRVRAVDTGQQPAVHTGHTMNTVLFFVSTVLSLVSLLDMFHLSWLSSRCCVTSGII